MFKWTEKLAKTITARAINWNLLSKTITFAFKYKNPRYTPLPKDMLEGSRPLSKNKFWQLKMMILVSIILSSFLLFVALLKILDGGLAGIIPAVLLLVFSLFLMMWALVLWLALKKQLTINHPVIKVFKRIALLGFKYRETITRKTLLVKENKDHNAAELLFDKSSKKH